MQTRLPSIEHPSVRQRVRRALLIGMASAQFAAISTPSFAQHAGMGPVDPPVRLADAQLIDQTGRKRLLSDLLNRRVTALQSIYTGCSSVCPLQGALFSTVQERMSAVRARHPVQQLSIGIDPLSDSPAALHD